MLLPFYRAGDGTSCVAIDLGLAFETDDKEELQAEQSALRRLLSQVHCFCKVHLRRTSQR